MIGLNGLVYSPCNIKADNWNANVYFIYSIISSSNPPNFNKFGAEPKDLAILYNIDFFSKIETGIEIPIILFPDMKFEPILFINAINTVL